MAGAHHVVDGRCLMSDLPPEQCAGHTDAGDRVAPRPLDIYAKAARDRELADPGVRAAAYPGRCQACGEDFDAGEPIRSAIPFGYSRGWIGSCCPDEELA